MPPHQGRPGTAWCCRPTVVLGVASVPDCSFLWIVDPVVVLVHDRSFLRIADPVVVLVHAQPFPPIIGLGLSRGLAVWVMLFSILM